ncbi:uncharacterized protein LOC115594757 [Sparus aurata]|uniref:uncharacterized protein LOC115594757 n=1 Tax=Sparus aurata TaxID=8175 RepID=UPI0011C15E10|nr:uncharacterized protein LOC115594757 [Sparus aurata]
MATKNGLNEQEKQIMDNGEKRKIYEKRLTIMAEIEGDDIITMMELLRKVKEECGEVIGCRFKTPKSYEITMLSDTGKSKLMDGLKIKNNIIMARELGIGEMVVSFINLPTYIDDETILGKLRDWGVKPVSSIRRRMWPGTEIADGTRFLKVKFNETVKSLPYSTKFETAAGSEHFRVIHDRQVKVCRLCIQPGHIVRDCPAFSCYKCGGQGHYARECAEQQERQTGGEDNSEKRTDQEEQRHNEKDQEASPLGPTGEEQSQAEEMGGEEEQMDGEEELDDAAKIAEDTPMEGGEETGDTFEGGGAEERVMEEDEELEREMLNLSPSKFDTELRPPAAVPRATAVTPYRFLHQCGWRIQFSPEFTCHYFFLSTSLLF